MTKKKKGETKLRENLWKGRKKTEKKKWGATKFQGKSKGAKTEKKTLTGKQESDKSPSKVDGTRIKHEGRCQAEG